MKKMVPPLLRIAVLLILVFSFSEHSIAQNLKEIKGTVVDANAEAIPGVSVLVKGTNRAAVTGLNGEYSVRAENGETLVFSFLSFETQEVTVASEAVINIQLKESTSRLDEVVVVGYGTQKRATLTGSVASVSSKELKMNPTLNISNSIAGLLPGVVASNRSGEPGRDGSKILIRGRSTTDYPNPGDLPTPLIVIDGIPGANGWEHINPNDVESISVLKDASAAIYGAQAANG